MALGLIGEKRIDTFGDTSTKEGRFTKLYYEQTRDEVLNEVGVHFNEVKARSGPLAAVTDQPSFGWEFAYQVPADCTRVTNLVGETSDEPTGAIWSREGDYILTNEECVYITYLKRISDDSKITPNVVTAIYTLLASKLAIPIATDPQLARSLKEEYYSVLKPLADGTNQAEGFVDDKGNQDWITVGRTKSA
jgi:hypothetical protein